MHTVTIKFISDSTVSNTNSDSYDPHDSMGKVGYSIEQLDIILYKSYPASQNWMKRIDQFLFVLVQKSCILNSLFLTVQ